MMKTNFQKQSMNSIPLSYDAPQTLVERLRVRAHIRRNAVGRDHRPDGKSDRLTLLLEEAADEIQHLEDIRNEAYRKGCI